MGRRQGQTTSRNPETGSENGDAIRGTICRGGAVLFDILSAKRPKEVFINDVNRELICVYTTVRDNPEALIRVWVSRLIGSKTESRGKVTELLISNF